MLKLHAHFIVGTARSHGLHCLNEDKWANYTYDDSKKTPSLIFCRAFCAPGFLANSTIASPVGLPRSSTMTTARSTTPNCAKASAKSSFEHDCGMFLTLKAAPCVAKRTLTVLPLRTIPSSSALAVSALKRVSCMCMENNPLTVRST